MPLKTDRVFDYSLSLSGTHENDTLLYDGTHYRGIFADSPINLTYDPRK